MGSMLQLFRGADKEKARNLSTLTNPFRKESVDRITIEIYPETSSWRGGKKIEATVWFKNGNTSGHHRIFSDTLDELMDIVMQELQNLEQ